MFCVLSPSSCHNGVQKSMFQKKNRRNSPKTTYGELGHCPLSLPCKTLPITLFIKFLAFCKSLFHSPIISSSGSLDRRFVLVKSARSSCDVKSKFCWIFDDVNFLFQNFSPQSNERTNEQTNTIFSLNVPMSRPTQTKIGDVTQTAIYLQRHSNNR